MEVVSQFRSKHDRLLALAMAKGDPELVDLARLLRSYLKRAWKDLERFASIPLDADETCCCSEAPELALPQALTEQLLKSPASRK
jgi:hypothetical protein